ncbi:MAG: alpha-amylase family glycosyl hydrolase [Myxococcota bacterium]|jgi:glycosidase|nr:alpha-amylase family glycosyl hydrolase [Myxococcota bacterium]
MTRFEYTAQEQVDAVHLAGTFNDWNTESIPMVDHGDGTWTVEIELEPGPWPYKFIEIDQGFYEDELAWSCDPDAEFIQCDSDYKEPDDTTWSQVCSPGTTSCNSMRIVTDCRLPTLTVDDLDVLTESGTIQASISASSGAQGAPLASGSAYLDQQEVSGAWNGAGFTIDVSGLDPSRHQLHLVAVDEDGRESNPTIIPFWTDDWDWTQGVVYFAFTDRLARSDPSTDTTEGATAALGDYLGGDWKGLQGSLPYLEELGVSILWLPNPLENAEGAWPGTCDLSYTGYHGYWPDHPTNLEEHFGDEEDLRALIEDAHGRNMRVIVDFVGNHVHLDHPVWKSDPEWFTSEELCEDDSSGTANWDRIPETCWFAEYLPSFDHSLPEPGLELLDQVMQLAADFELDGLRVDAAKHMPHSLHWNLASTVRLQVEHSEAGGEFVFWLIGETFDNAERIDAYVTPEQLDGQFDFPLYYAIDATFAAETEDVSHAFEQLDSSLERYGEAPMSTFLGNHDVSRFLTRATGDDPDVCTDTGLLQATAPGSLLPYERLRLAWVFLLTQPGIPLVYYGDEFGMPGHGDPDNRQPTWWYAPSLEEGTGLAELMQDLQAGPAMVLEAVARLATARTRYPALSGGTSTNWWVEPDVYAQARVVEDQAVLVILNRSDEDRSLENSLSFAGLATEGTYIDLLTDETFEATDDWMVVDVNRYGARVLVLREES